MSGSPRSHAGRTLAVALLLAAGPMPAAAQPDSVARAAFMACLERDTATAWQAVNAAWGDERTAKWTDDALRRRLLALAEADQAVRPMGAWPPAADSAFWTRLRARDSTNEAALRAIIARHGWPGKSLVGAKGASAAFLVAQHNAALQRDALRLMRALPAGEVSPSDLAMLEDRVMVGDGLPQRYGTQLRPPENGVAELYPIEDLALLDERRAAAGLPPFDTYLCMMRAGSGVEVRDPRIP